MQIDVTEHPEVAEIIRGVSEHVSSSFPDYVSPEDVAQTLWIWVLENKKAVLKAMTEHVESWTRIVYATLKREAYTYALKEEAETQGYSTDDTFFYTLPVIRELLKDAFDHENWQSFQTFGDGQPRAKGQANQTGDRLAMLADVTSAVEKLNEEQWSLVISHYKYGAGYEALGEQLEITPKAARERLRRAEGAVQRLLGRRTPSDMRQDRIRDREAYSSDSAQWVTDKQYQG